MCVTILPTYMYLHHVHIWCLRKSEEGIESPETDLQMVVSQPVHSGTSTQVFQENNSS